MTVAGSKPCASSLTITSAGVTSTAICLTLASAYRGPHASILIVLVRAVRLYPIQHLFNPRISRRLKMRCEQNRSWNLNRVTIIFGHNSFHLTKLNMCLRCMNPQAFLLYLFLLQIVFDYAHSTKSAEIGAALEFLTLVAARTGTSCIAGSPPKTTVEAHNIWLPSAHPPLL